MVIDTINSTQLGTNTLESRGLQDGLGSFHLLSFCPLLFYLLKVHLSFCLLS